ncbi:MAG: lysophospholipid acyltransferase family protein [Verrucomicrobiales bacterium]|nr:1-acyl-sn-glycerol-3-phosphate acyltransferase [Verrucomicrobiae bacterium]MCP5555396.1 1-acyl-sn-glycerol-3-phosphate acyltransferase [Akkermansiaceae bacterium]
MQNLIPEHPYHFVPPRFSRFWTWLVSFRLPAMLRNRFGVTEVEFLGLERLADSLAEGHGILVAPNHSHPADPFIAAGLGLRVGRPVHLMATRHIFEESALQRFLLTRVGNFSVSREGTDFRAIRCAENIIVEARHPLVMFPEGIVTRSNDRLIPFQRGVSLIARRAAARRAREGGRVVVHPMFIRYTHQGNVEAAVEPVLADLGKRIGRPIENALPLRERILNLGEALLADKEREYCGEPGTGPLIPRIERLIEVVLAQVEPRWVRHMRARDAMARVRIIRSAIVGHLYRTAPGSPERQAMWRDIEHLYLVQLLYCYPPGYLEESCVTNDRLLEIVEHFEEDLTDVSRPHPPMRAVGWVGEALPVEPFPRRPPRPDPWTSELKTRMESLRVASLKNP